jgi:hypothetical protein
MGDYEDAMATFSQLMKAFGTLYGADEQAISGQLRGRIQNLQKLGIPIGLGSKTGRGRAIDYRRNEIYQLAFCLELFELGLTPGHVAKIVSTAWDSLAPEFEKEWTSPSADDAVLIIETSLMSGTWNREFRAAARENHEVVQGTAITRSSLTKIPALFADRLGAWRHCGVLNLTRLVTDVERELAHALPQVVAWLTEKQPGA